ncbi:MAG: hypothetical protein IT394_14215 [Candidatus Omnitrophica bacterium]|nr:hypothetical protein [Candidatus Omnitrophota bacterium]
MEQFHRGQEKDRSIYAGTFVIALASLAFEVCLTRLLSVITWYSLAFFAISTAMVGMTAGAVRIYLRPAQFNGSRFHHSISSAACRFGLSVAGSLLILCQLPLTIDPAAGIMGAIGLLTATAALVIPFYYSGIAITAALTRSGLPVGKIYGFDLVGAALGCLTALAFLNRINTPACILLFGSFGGLAALLYSCHSGFSWKKALPGGLVFIVLAGLAASNGSPWMIRPLFTKGKLLLPSLLAFEEWNSLSRVTVYPPDTRPAFFWAESPVAPKLEYEQYVLTIDGKAGTVLSKREGPEQLDNLRYDLTNLAYWLRPNGGACIIGVGGGRDILSARAFGHQNITAIEINPIFIDLLQNRFREYAGIAVDPEIKLVVDEARSWLAGHDQQFRVIQMSMIDTWAATTSGAFALSENGLYTLEAWKLFLSRLSEDGIFTVSRWYDPDYLGESGRMIALACAALLERGATQLADHIAVVTSPARLATLIISPSPFTPGDRQYLRETIEKLQFTPVILPGEKPSDERLASMLAAQNTGDLESRLADQPLNFNPPTDNNPFFFNMLRFKGLRELINRYPETVRGNLIANLTLVILVACLGILVALTILAPLWSMRKKQACPQGLNLSSAAFFSLIGAAFMLVEIALLQRVSILLGQPVLAFVVALFTLILSSGLGSFISQAIDPRSTRVFVLPILVGSAVFLSQIGFLLIQQYFLETSTLIRAFLCLLILFPLGMLMGMFYPTGMRLVGEDESSQTPWYWALNGIFGVFSSALAVLISIQLGISATLGLGSVCYLMVLVCLPGMREKCTEAGHL